MGCAMNIGRSIVVVSVVAPCVEKGGELKEREPMVETKVDPVTGELNIKFFDDRQLTFNVAEGLVLFVTLRKMVRWYLMEGKGAPVERFEKVGVDKILAFLDRPVPEEERLDTLMYLEESESE